MIASAIRLEPAKSRQGRGGGGAHARERPVLVVLVLDRRCVAAALAFGAGRTLSRQ